MAVKSVLFIYCSGMFIWSIKFWNILNYIKKPASYISILSRLWAAFNSTFRHTLSNLWRYTQSGTWLELLRFNGNTTNNTMNLQQWYRSELFKLCSLLM